MPDVPLEEQLEQIADRQQQIIDKLERLDERLDFVDVQIQQIREEFRWNGPVSFAATVFDRLKKISAEIAQIDKAAFGKESGANAEGVAAHGASPETGAEDVASSKEE